MAKASGALGTGFNPVHDHDHCVADALSAAEQVCRKHGARLTSLRRRVLELVWQSHRPVGAYAVLDLLKPEHRAAAPPTVYRALDFLLEQGLVHRIQSLNAFVGCAHPDQVHHGFFLICKSCGDAIEVEDDGVDGAISRSAERFGFQVQARTIEAAGICPGCNAA
jgi:Fur family zinc uptake transcriptional regulator